MIKYHILIHLLLTTPLLSQGFFEYDYDVSPMGVEVNSGENDYAPVETSDGGQVYFTSGREEGSLGKADIYRMSRSGPGEGAKWGRLMNPGSPFNTDGDDGSLALFREDRMIVFATEGRSDGAGSTDLYVARFDRGRLSDIRSLGATINSEKWESQPAISPDERYLYFVSNRPGGLGGGDIWVAEKVGEDADGFPLWGHPVNLGPDVNTKKEERSPTLALDGRTLYFASTGWKGFGGYDIYMTLRDDGAWSTPVNLGSIINSSEDDLFFFAPRNDQPFYFASARNGGAGGLDIYNGTPNVFGRGLFRLTLNLLDNRQNGLDGTGYVLDSESGDTVSRILTVSAREDYVVHLPAGRSYEVIGVTQDGLEQRQHLGAVEPNGAEQVDLIFGARGLNGSEQIDLGAYTIPFFVTGYYRPNTTENLEELFDRREGDLKAATYIEQFDRYTPQHQQYTTWGRQVEDMFAEVRYRFLDDLLPRFAATAASDEVLEIRVTGYADPQTFTGSYYEPGTISFVDTRSTTHTITSGDRITNLELSGLRAHYSTLHIDELLSTGPEGSLYRRLRSEGRIRYVAVAGDVATDVEGERFEVQRRIGVEVGIGN